MSRDYAFTPRQIYFDVYYINIIEKYKRYNEQLLDKLVFNNDINECEPLNLKDIVSERRYKDFMLKISSDANYGGKGIVNRG